MVALDEVLGVRVRRQASVAPASPTAVIFERSLPGGDQAVTISRTPEGYHLACFGCVYVEVAADGSGVAIDARPPAGDADVDDLLVRVVLTLIGQLRGRPLLHGSAVSFGERAVGFVGATGAGKSTLAAFSADRGAQLLADDSLLLGIVGEAVHVSPTAERIRVRDTARLGLLADGAEIRTNGKLAIPKRTADRPAPLTHLYVLTGAGDELKFDRLRPRDATVHLAQHLFRIDPSSATMLRSELDFLESVAQRVPVTRLTYPHDPAFAQATFDRVLCALGNEAVEAAP